ncbi:MAG: hypothetical protein Q4B28_02880 [bacterium]|nr:hypothetical protein [bacterium]
MFMAFLASLIFYLVVNWYPQEKRKRKVAPHIRWLVHQILQTGYVSLKEFGGTVDDSDEEFKDKIKTFNSSKETPVYDLYQEAAYTRSSREIIKENTDLCLEWIRELLLHYEYLDSELIEIINNLRSDCYFKFLHVLLYANIQSDSFFLDTVCRYKNLLKSLKDYGMELESRYGKDDQSLR